MTRTPRRQAFRPRSESLESRELMAVFTVTNTAEYGRGTLNFAINQSNETPGPNVINFAISRAPGTGVTQVINEPPAGFPAITRPVTINGFTQPFSQPNTAAGPLNNNAQWGILLHAVSTSSPSVLTIGPGGSGSEVRGLVFASSVRITAGLTLDRVNNVKVDGDGFVAGEDVGLLSAVRIDRGSNNVIGGDPGGAPALRNVMNSYLYGVTLNTGSQHNAITGNYIGGQTSLVGTLDAGVFIQPQANFNNATNNALVFNRFPIYDQGIGNVQQNNVVVPRA